MHGSGKGISKSTGTDIPDDSRLREVKYTQRDWDRTVGWGKVPEKYKLKINQKK